MSARALHHPASYRGARPERALRARAAFFALHVGLPLAFGTAIYFAWRSSDLRLIGWARALGLDDALAAMRGVLWPLRTGVPRFVRYSAPDGLWAYAAASFMGGVWRDGPDHRRLAWMAAGPALAVAWELGQLARLLPGTFDAADVLAYFAAFAAALLAHHVPRRARST